MLDRCLTKLARTLAPLAIAGLVSRAAAAGEPAATSAQTERERAAAAYDEAVRLSARAEYETAARKFLEADAIFPSVDALSNAIVAARRANAHLLVAEAAERAMRREGTEPDLATGARAALAEAELRLSRLVLSCHPAPCELDVDGSTVPAGRRHVLPGVHVVSAMGPSGARTEERLTTAAGAEYVVALEATPAPPPGTSTPASPGRPPSAPLAAPGSSEAPPQALPLRPWVFYVGLGTTVALAGVTTWSGIDTLNAKADLPNPSSEEKNADVLDRGHRTDWLLGGTLVVAAATAAVGLVWVDWGPSEHAGLMLSPVPGGAVVGLVGAHR
jgi:hypothetical protein